MKKKKLSEMTLEELWELFPIFLTEHQNIWAIWAEEEKELLQGLLGGLPVRISHIGSTAVPDIWAKPIIDMLIELPESGDMESVRDRLTENGYVLMNRSPGRISLNKGYTEDGFAEKVFHIHVRFAGDHDELYFRDYLIEHSDAAREYEALKLQLWKEFEHDRDGYTAAKTEFVAKYTKLAKERYAGRYE